jgi:hypothetical protein
VLTRKVVDAAFDLKSALEARKAPGAPSPANVGRELARWKKALGG